MALFSAMINMEVMKKFALIDAIGISASAEKWIPKPVLATDIPFISERENLGENINTTYEELLPVISPDGKELFICRGGDPKGKGSQDIWKSERTADGSWGKAVNIGAPLNNGNPNFVCSVTPDGNKLIVGGSYENASADGISICSRGKDGNYEMPAKVLIKNFYNRRKYNEFCMSNSGKVILMTIERDDSYGGRDIYFSLLQADGTWSEPKHTGSSLNTAADEASPFLASDEKTLYFSSNGHIGYGSNDIFMTKRLDDSWTSWTEPVNLGSQINSEDWDAYYTLPASADYAYFASTPKSIRGIDFFLI